MPEQTDPFASPSETGPKITDYKGSLMLLTPTSHETGVTTPYGEADPVVTDMVVLDGPALEGGDPEEFSAVYVFQGRLIGALKGKVGKGMVLGRLGQAAPTTKGHSPSWVLEDPTDEDRVKARAYLAEKDPFS